MHMANIKLTSSRLKVVIRRPGTFYKGSRFDWTGFVTDVTLDDVHTFCVSESLIPGGGSGGRGLCNEFGIHEPIGYDEAEVGGGFPKLGTGIITKTSYEPYNFYKPAPVKPFPCEVESSSKEAVFTTKPVMCNGYACLLVKKLAVEDNRLSVQYSLKNTGSKPIATSEYVHNFVSIDHKDIGPDYRLSFSFPLEGGDAPKIFQVKGNSIGWKRTATDEFYWAPRGYDKAEETYWELVDVKSGTGIRETDSFAPLRIGIWGKTHVVSPEVFIAINLQPEEEMSWTRVYTFFTA